MGNANDAVSRIMNDRNNVIERELRNIADGTCSAINIHVPKDLHNKLDKTVFILGAGSSCSYGFPTGDALLKHLKQFKNRNDEMNGVDHGFYQYMINYFKSKRNIKDFEQQLDLFVEELNDSGVRSIDTFLSEVRNDENLHKHLGKILISYLITICEDRRFIRVNSDDDDWISYFINRLISYSRNKFKENPPKVLTFNYDNLFETKIKSNFDKTTGESLSPLIIKHIYGQVDPSNYEYSNANWDKVDKEAFYKRIVQSSAGITLVRERESNNDKLLKEIEEADFLVFLGYSFDPINNQVLFGSRESFDNCLRSKKVFSTTYGLHKDIIRLIYGKGTIKADIKCKDLIERLYPPPLFPEDI